MTWLTCRQLEARSRRASGSDGAVGKSLLWVLLRYLFKYFVCNSPASCGFREKSRRLLCLTRRAFAAVLLQTGPAADFCFFFRSLRRSGWVS